MSEIELPRTRPALVDPDRIFRILHSFTGFPAGAVIVLGIVSVMATGFIEWATVLPFPNDVVFVLIIGGVAFHGSTVAGVSLGLLAALTRVVATGASAVWKSASLSLKRTATHSTTVMGRFTTPSHPITNCLRSEPKLPSFASGSITSWSFE